MGYARIYTGQLRGRLKQGAERACSIVADQIIADERPFVPMQEGALRDCAHVVPGEGSAEIVYDTPYAAYQYYGCWPDGSHAVKRHSTPGTYTQWHERAKRRYLQDWLEVYQNAYREGMG